jgi:outer membrane immunogenic protein
MFDGSPIKGSGSNPSSGPLFPQTNSATFPWFTTLTGQAGVVVLPSTLIYAKGGAAWLKDNDTVTLTATGTPTVAVSYTVSGWTLGAGIEHMFAPHWSVFVEYDYMGFGTTTQHSSLLVTPFTSVSSNINQNFQTALVGISFRY